MGDDDLRGLGRGDVGIQPADQPDRKAHPTSCAAMYERADGGAMPANVSENIRPTVIAGLAKLVELVNQ
jgi:hypothetical protein